MNQNEIGRKDNQSFSNSPSNFVSIRFLFFLANFLIHFIVIAHIKDTGHVHGRGT